MDFLTLGIGILIGIVVGGAIAWGFFSKKLATAEPAGEIADAINQLEERVPQILAKARDENNSKEWQEYVKRTQEFKNAQTEITVFLKEIEKKRTEAYGGLLGKTEDLATTTEKLKSILSNTTQRGKWGEFGLIKVVEFAGLKEDIHFVYNKAIEGTTSRPDMIVFTPDGGNIAIDSKLSLDNYINAVNEPAKQKEFLDQYVKDVKTQIKNLANKNYHTLLDKSPPFTVMYVELESALVCAFEHDNSLLDFALQNNVLITSPTLLIGLLKSTAYGFDLKDISLSAKKLQDEVDELFRRLVVFTKHLNDMGTGLKRAVDSHNKSIGSFNRKLRPQVEKISNLRQAGGDVHLSALEDIDESPREITDE